jgi:hypothetical protein
VDTPGRSEQLHKASSKVDKVQSVQSVDVVVNSKLGAGAKHSKSNLKHPKSEGHRHRDLRKLRRNKKFLHHDEAYEDEHHPRYRHRHGDSDLDRQDSFEGSHSTKDRLEDDDENDSELVMNTGYPRPFFWSPAPIPTNTHTHSMGTGIPRSWVGGLQKPAGIFNIPICMNVLQKYVNILQYHVIDIFLFFIPFFNIRQRCNYLDIIIVDKPQFTPCSEAKERSSRVDR